MQKTTHQISTRFTSERIAELTDWSGSADLGQFERLSLILEADALFAGAVRQFSTITHNWGELRSQWKANHSRCFECVSEHSETFVGRFYEFSDGSIFDADRRTAWQRLDDCATSLYVCEYEDATISVLPRRPTSGATS